MTHVYHGLSRAFLYVKLEPIKFVVDSSNELVYRISCCRELFHSDGDGDAVVGLLKGSSQTFR